MKKKILYIDMDGVLVDFQSGIDQFSKEVLEEYYDREDEIPGIFGKMKPIKGAIESYIELSKIFDTYILSTAPWKNETALVDKLRWVKKHLGEVAYKRLILTHHKNLNKGDFLIDDRVKNGVDLFAGEHLHFGKGKKYPDWESVINYLKKTYKMKKKSKSEQIKQSKETVISEEDGAIINKLKEKNTKEFQTVEDYEWDGTGMTSIIYDTKEANEASKAEDKALIERIKKNSKKKNK